MTTMAVAFITGASALVLGGAAPAQASCGSLTDKSIAGTLSGDDGRAVNAMVGFTYVDEFGYRLDVRGCRLSGDAYGRVFHLNAGVPETGTAPTSATSDRFFIGNIPSAVKEVWVETYPKTPGGATSYRRYAGVYQPAVAPGRMNLNLRLPLTCAAGGRTGAIVASVFIGGRQVTPTWMGYWSETASSKQMGYALSGGSPGGFVSPPLSSSPGANGRPQTYEVAIFYKGTTYWRHGLPVYACKTTHVRIDE
jgi:hypothetical protein